MLFEKKHMKLLTHLPKEKLVREGWTDPHQRGRHRAFLRTPV